jgi:hypothetical protein
VTLTATITDTLPGPVTPNEVVTWPPVALTLGEVWTQQFNVTVDPGYTGLLTNKLEVTTQSLNADTLEPKPAHLIDGRPQPVRNAPSYRTAGGLFGLEHLVGFNGT